MPFIKKSIDQFVTMYDFYFRYASHILDDILRTRSNILALNQINNLQLLVSQMNDHQLANFCRVLYFVLTDAEACEDRNTCK